MTQESSFRFMGNNNGEAGCTNPKKINMSPGDLKSNHFKVNFIFQPSIFNTSASFHGRGNDSETRLSFFSISFCCGFQVCIPSLIAPYLASSSRVGNTNVLLLLMKKGPQLYDSHGLPWAALPP